MASDYFWKKKAIISYFLSILVFWIHIASFAYYPLDASTISKINYGVNVICTKLYTPIAVPLFFILSGAVFFRDYLPTKYKDKVKGRIRTLAVPYLLWNILFTIFNIVTSYSFISNYFMAREKFVISPYNIIMSVFLYRSGPFWFIFCLMVFVIISPIIYAVLQNKYVGIISILIIVILDYFGIGLPEFFFYSKESIIYYLVGAMIGIHYRHWFIDKATKKQLMLGAIGFAVYSIFSYRTCVRGIENNAAFEVVLTVIGGISFWRILDLVIDNVKERGFMHHSFMIYAMHINVSAIISKIVYILCPKGVYMACPNFIFTTVLTLLIIEYCCVLMKIYLPKIYMLLSGGRV